MQIARYLIACSLVLLVSGNTPAPVDGTVKGTVAVFDKSKRVAKPEDVWVYLEREGPTPTLPGKGVSKAIIQKNVKFDPRVLVIPVGATVSFPNKDPIEHNVFSPWIDARRVGFDNLRYPAGKGGKTRTFNKVGEFKIYCDIHKDMSAMIKVVPTTDFTKVREDGTYQFPNVPPGRYKVGAWSPSTKDPTSSTEDNKSDVIEIIGDETAKVDPIHLHRVVIDAAHLRKDGTPYPVYP